LLDEKRRSILQGSGFTLQQQFFLFTQFFSSTFSANARKSARAPLSVDKRPMQDENVTHKQPMQDENVTENVAKTLDLVV